MKKNISSNDSENITNNKYYYYLNDDSVVSSKVVIRRVKRITKKVYEQRSRFSLIDDFVKEEIRIKISNKKRNRKSIKNFFQMTLLRNDFSDNDKVYLSKKLNKNFSHRERLCKKYHNIFKENYKRIKKLYGNYQEKYRKKLENLV